VRPVRGHRQAKQAGGAQPSVSRDQFARLVNQNGNRVQPNSRIDGFNVRVGMRARIARRFADAIKRPALDALGGP